MLLYLRTSKGDINTQNTGDKANEIVDGSHGHYPWAFPNSLEPYEIRRSQSEFLSHDTGDMLIAVKTIGKDNDGSEMYIGIDGSFYQRYGQRVLDVSDFPIGFKYLTSDETPTVPSFGSWRVYFYGYTIGIDGARKNPVYEVIRVA